MYKHADITEKIIGVFYDVYNELGNGFLESIYEHAMLLALSQAGLSAEAQKAITVNFRGRTIGDFKADIIVEQCLLLELKCVDHLTPVHLVQALTYLKLLRFKRAYLLNFKSRLLKDGIKRVSN